MHTQLYFSTRQPRPLLPDLGPSQPGRQHTGQQVRTWTAGALVRERKPDTGKRHGSTHWPQDPAWQGGAPSARLPTDCLYLTHRHASPAGLLLTGVVALVYVAAILYEE